MKLRYYMIALVLATGGLVIGSLLIPRGGEMALIYYRAGYYKTAMEILERELDKHNLTTSNVHYAALTYLKVGEVEKAAKLVERYIADHPEDIPARQLLGRLYHEAGKPALFLYNLEQLEAAAPSAKTRVMLKDLYWRTGDYTRWAAMLRRLIEDGDGAPEDFVALARLEASKGRKAEAIRYLTALRKRSAKAFALDELTLLVVLYLETGQPDEATRTATGWLEEHRKLQTALDLAFQFQRRGRYDAALRLLHPFADRAPESPPLLRTLTDLEISAGEPGRAQRRLAELEARGALKPDQLSLLIAASLSSRDWPAAKQAFEKARIGALPRDLILRVLNEAASRDDRAFADRLSARIGDSFRRDNPVAAARLALLTGDRPEAEKWALFAQSRTLGTDDRLNLVAVLVQLGQTERAEAQLRLVSEAGGVSDYQLLRLAVLLRKFDMTAEGKALFDGLDKTRKSAWLTAARGLLTTSMKPGGSDSAWLDGLGVSGRGARDLFGAIYAAALELKLNALAADAAGRLVKLDDSPVNRIRQARALEKAGDTERAFAILKPLVQKYPAARQAYADAVVSALKAGTMKPAQARGFLDDYLRDANVPLTQRKYLLYDLLGMKAFDIVLPVTAGLAESHPKLFARLHFEALIQSGDKSAFAREVNAAIDRTRDLARLKMLGRLAFQESQMQIAKKAYGKVRAIRPDDPAALRHLGLIASWSNDPATAQRLLSKYLASGKSDYQAEFTLAEAISRLPEWRQATPLYNKVIRAIDALKSPTLDDLKMRAQALHRSGQFDAAARAYEQLIRRNPKNRKLLNEYVDFLYAIGRYGRAQEVLSRHRW